MIAVQAAINVMMVGEAIVPTKAVVLAVKETPKGETYIIQKFGSRLFGLATGRKDGELYCEQTLVADKINLDEIQRQLGF